MRIAMRITGCNAMSNALSFKGGGWLRNTRIAHYTHCKLIAMQFAMCNDDKALEIPALNAPQKAVTFLLSLLEFSSDSTSDWL